MYIENTSGNKYLFIANVPTQKLYYNHDDTT